MRVGNRAYGGAGGAERRRFELLLRRRLYTYGNTGQGVAMWFESAVAYHAFRNANEGAGRRKVGTMLSRLSTLPSTTSSLSSALC